jgi:nitrogen fixation protein NifU and related proteins
VIKDLYREVILQHYQSPTNRREIADPDLQGSAQNPLCGDELTIFVRLADDRIADAAFQARGCSISQASADMMAEAVRGKTLDEASAEIQRFERLMQGEAPDDEPSGELEALVSVRRFPVRVKCALMPWTTLGEAIERHRAAE